MKGMPEAIDRIDRAIAAGERILIYGDYDVDGTTSVALVYGFLRRVHPHIDYYIPDRYKEGYGISTAGIDYAVANGYGLIIALDCGIKSVDKVAYARGLGVDFIICDHHLPGEEVPSAIAVLDPKQQDCPYPYKELSGCGIGFKLIQAYAMRHDISMEVVYHYIDLVAVSIGCDIVPITGENRIIAYHGLYKINTNPCEGIKALMAIAKVNRKLDISDVVFILGPRINAAGRIDDARHAVKLLLAEEEALSKIDADTLQTLNKSRKELDKTITDQALALVLNDPAMVTRITTVVYHEDWHKGVIGIVASRLIEHSYRPTIVLTLSDGKVTGSARSIKGFDLYEALYECREYLIQFGGHKFAAGLTMLPENVASFVEAFDVVAKQRLSKEQLVPEIEIDAELDLTQITPKFYSIMQQMAPFGPQNMKPIFLTQNLRDSQWSKVLKETHLKLSIRRPYINDLIDGIGFGLGHHYELVKNQAFDICYQLEENVYNEKTSIQLVVKEVKGSEG
jgi:single-stranded-DNA-specific exonuclease